MNVTPVIPRSTQTLTRVGVIGGGQLAWMMGGAARDLGLSLIVQTPHSSDPAVPFAADTVWAEIGDAGATAELAKRCDVITFENEFIDLDALSVLAQSGVCFRPRLEALAPLLDKFDQLCQLRDLGIPVPRFEALTRPGGDPTPKIDHGLGYPVVLKARRHGYDGQGTFIIPDAETLDRTWAKFNYPPMLLQEFVPFERELATIAARSVAGDVAIFPIVFASGLEAASGPGLIFQTLPIAFGSMPGGQWFGTVFFVLLVFAAWSSSISLVEPAVAWLVESRRWSRSTAALVIGGFAWVLGIGSVLSFNLWSGEEYQLLGKTLFDLKDFLASNIMLPLGGLLIALFVGYGAGRQMAIEELSISRQRLFDTWWRVIRYVSPVGIAIVFLNSVGVF